MSALEWFESIRTDGERIEKIKQNLAMLESRIAPRSQGYEPMGHGGGSSDAMLGMALVSIQIGKLKAELPRVERRLEARMERATNILYGKSGRGGLAKAKGTTDADIICCHYLQGMGWAEIAQEIVRKETDYPTQWCRQRALRAFAYMDRVGMDVLADS